MKAVTEPTYLDNFSSFNWTPTIIRITGLEPAELNKSSTNGQGQLVPPTSENASPYALIGLVCIPVVSLIGSLVTALAVICDKRLHHTSYYFAVSMSFMHAVMAVSVIPSAILVTWHGEYQCTDATCKFWITTDLFFCNNTCLHLAFINMDSFLRLKDPLRHGHNSSVCSLALWIGAPWVVSFVQSVAQFVLSQADADSRSRPGLCIVADRNFVILSTLFSFVIPMIVGICFEALCRAEMRSLKDRVFCAGMGTSQSQLRGSAEWSSSRGQIWDGGKDACSSVADDTNNVSINTSDSTSCCESDRHGSLSADLDDEASMMTEHVQLEVVVTSACDGDQTGESSVESCAEETSFYKDRHGTSSDNAFVDLRLTNDDGRTEPIGSASSVPDRNSANSMPLLESDATDCTENENRFKRHAGNSCCTGRQSTANFRSESNGIVPDQIIRQELVLSRMTRWLMVIYVALWMPMAVSNVIYGSCQPCRDVMTFAEIVTVKWLAYSSAAIGPFACAQFSELMRQAYWSVLTLKPCRRNLRSIT